MVVENVSRNIKDRASAVKTAVTGQVTNVKNFAGGLGSFTPVQNLNTLRKNIVDTQANHINTQCSIIRRWA